MYYVYALIDERTNNPFYIGKGKIKKKRHLDHFKETIDTTENRHKFFKIQFLKENGYNIPVKILEDNILDEDLAYMIETKYIKLYGRENIDENGILTNICLDNKPPHMKNKKQTEEHVRKRMQSRAKTVNDPDYIKPEITEETRSKKSKLFSGTKNPFYGKKHSSDTKKILAELMKGNTYNVRTYKFTSPTKEEYIVDGFQKFCIDNKLTIPTMEKIMRKKKTATSGPCKGWLVERVYNLNFNQHIENQPQVSEEDNENL